MVWPESRAPASSPARPGEPLNPDCPLPGPVDDNRLAFTLFLILLLLVLAF